jgi:sigma-54-specific transcriptional regulator
MHFADSIAKIMPMLSAVDEAALAAQALQLWQQSIAIEDGWFLRLSFDGRHLQRIAQLKQNDCEAPLVSFCCETFDQPFSHVAFSGKPLHLTQLQNPNLQNDQYVRWLKNSHQDTHMYIEPVYHADKLLGIWAIKGNTHSVVQDEDIKAIKQLFSKCIVQLNQYRQAALKQSTLVNKVNALRSDILTTEQRQLIAKQIIGRSEQSNKLREKIVIAARSELNVLINGETGVGKELVANAIHQFSKRSDKPFIALNCAAIPETLLESELFGYVKGAFSGANEHSKGLLGQAHQGVFFLDEIGDMPLNLQAKLLRVIESRQYRQLGGTQELACDFRLVTATHRSLAERIKQKHFRSDLYYRLNSFPITVKPLRERKTDIADLATHFVEKFNQTHQRNITGISEKVCHTLQQLDFPGNVRQLKNIIDYTAVHSKDEQIIKQLDLSELEDEHKKDQSYSDTQPLSEITDTAQEYEGIDNFKQAVQRFESKIIIARLDKCSGNKSLAAQTLGLPRRTFTSICQRLALNN